MLYWLNGYGAAGTVVKSNKYEDERVVLFNCATGLKYPMPAADEAIDKDAAIGFGAL